MQQMSKGEQTRERVLQIAEEAVLAKGFSNTSIDEIIAAAELTKSGFFYHFKDKTDLAKALLERYLKNDDIILDSLFTRARELSDDPLHAFLVGLKLMAEMLLDMKKVHPGCMVAAVVYHDKQFNDEVRQLTVKGLMAWRGKFHDLLIEISEIYPPSIDVDFDEMADMLSVIVEGGIVYARAMQDQKVLASQIMLYRKFVKQIFLPEAKAAA